MSRGSRGAGGKRQEGLFPVYNIPSHFKLFYFYADRMNKKWETNLKAALSEHDIQKNVPRYYKNEPKLTLVIFYQLWKGK